MSILMDPSTNGHGRWLIQNKTTIWVLSGCCKATIDSNYTDDDSNHTWARCDECKEFLQINDDGWDSRLDDIDRWAVMRTRPEAWDRWGNFWFGLNEFAMEIKQ